MVRDRLVFVFFLLAIPGAFAQSLPPSAKRPHHPTKVIPRGVILVKGATPSASDSTTPVPEGAAVGAVSFESRYFGISYRVPPGWTEKVKGPPPSDSGSYVLALLVPSDSIAKSVKGSILIEAQDRFFNAEAGSNALETVSYVRNHLQPSQEVERAPYEVTIGGRSFARLDYGSPDIGLHWRILAVEVRCHIVQFIFSGPDPAALDRMVADFSHIEFSSAGRAPLCVADYAVSANIIKRVTSTFAARFNPIPVRITIDKQGQVKYVHVISAFAEQSAALIDAVMKWRFKPYRKNGRPMEIETGMLVGQAAQRPAR
jgi:hypothetical protein